MARRQLCAAVRLYHSPGAAGKQCHGPLKNSVSTASKSRHRISPCRCEKERVIMGLFHLVKPNQTAPGKESSMTDHVRTLDSPISVLSGAGPKRVEQLQGLGIFTLRDLLYHFPRSYQDRRIITPIAQVAKGDSVTIQARVKASRNIRMRAGGSMAVITLEDDTGSMNATFFGRGYLATSALRPSASGVFFGVVEEYQGLALKGPDYEILEEDSGSGVHLGRIVPIYRLTEKLTQRLLRGWIREVLDLAQEGLPETLPEIVRVAEGLGSLTDCIREVHFPESIEAAEAAKARLVFESLLVIQLGVLLKRRQRRSSSGIRHMINGPILKALHLRLPFTLTEAQDRCISEILRDLAEPRPMARLIQGDVGCGKTIVAAHAVAAALDGGFQVAFMAPTELLAEQQFQNFRRLFEPLDVRVELLTGSLRGAAQIRRGIAAGAAHFVVGTQALFQQKTEFSRLGLVIIDEQHRFGVQQREALAAKGSQPDLLHMTATPIPRSLAMTLYGGMDLSIIESLPPGRSPVKTRYITETKVPDCYAYIAAQAQKGFQTFIVCPLVEASELRQDSIAVEDHYAELTQGPLAGVRTGYIHGRLDPGEKDAIMKSFGAGDIDVLFSTTVIEVGIDVPNATTMVIENAAQFGLTQLHQLRGRVGRGKEQSYCFLMGKPTTKEGQERITIFCEMSSGFDLAEADLRLRGPGEVTGFRQAGFDDPHAAVWATDGRLLDRTRRRAERILEGDPNLADAGWDRLRGRILAMEDLAL